MVTTTFTRITFAFLICTIAACATPTQPIDFSKPSATQYDTDVAQCTYEVERAMATYGSSSPVPSSLGAAIAQGMSEGAEKGATSRRLAALCMRGRGYTLNQ